MVDAATSRSLEQLLAVASGAGRLESGSPIDMPYEAVIRPLALVGSFDPNHLQDAGEQPHLVERLRRDSVAGARGGRRFWTLRADVRRRVLGALLADGESLAQAIQDAGPPAEPLTSALRACILGRVRPLIDQNLDELTCTEQVLGWLDGLVPGLPSRTEAKAMSDRARLLAPLRDLADTRSCFSGRRKELAKLREFVGVLSPHTPLEGWMRGLSSLLGTDTSILLPITGVGGAGKSSLVAKFLLDHVLFDDPRQIPFAYVDFDRASLSPNDSPGLLIEMAHQLSAQYPPHAGRLNSMVEAMRERLRTHSGRQREQEGSWSEDGDPEAAEKRVEDALNSFRSAIQELGLSDKPYLVVFDTFEEAAYESADGLAGFWAFVATLRSITPLLRVVVSSRAMPAGRLPDGLRLARGIVVDELDLPSAQSYLEVRGVHAEIARNLVEEVGRLPLSLSLAARLIQQHGPEGLAGFSSRTWLGVRRSQKWIVGRLYGRILEHIHDPEVRRMAHPGLVVRVITPDVIQRVLAPACGLEDVGLARACELYDELRREVALVADEGTHLRHRADIRSRMIKLMCEDKPEEVRELHRRAVAYWRDADPASCGFNDDRIRAEEIYHLLSLSDHRAVVDRWTAGSETYLRRSLDELPDGSQDLVRKLSGVAEGVGTRYAGKAEPSPISSRARTLIRQGRAADALAILDGAGEDATTTGLVADALERLVRWPDLVTMVADRASDLRDYRLLTRGADVAFRIGDFAAATRFCGNAENHLSAKKGAATALQALDIDLVRLAVARANQSTADVERVAARCKARVDALGPQRFRRNLGTARRYALLAGDLHPGAVATYIIAMGPMAHDDADRLALARSMAAIEVRSGVNVRDAKPMRDHVSPADAESAWSTFLDEARPESSFDAIVTLLNNVSVLPSDAVSLMGSMGSRRPDDQRWVSDALAVGFPSVPELSELARVVLGSRFSTSEGRMAHRDLAVSLARRADGCGELDRLAQAARELRPGPETELVAGALARWRRAVEWTQAQSKRIPVPSASRSPPISSFATVVMWYSLPFVERVVLSERLLLTGIEERELDADLFSRLALQRARATGNLGALCDRLSSMSAGTN